MLPVVQRRAVMHVLFNEPLEGNSDNNSFRFEVIG